MDQVEARRSVESEFARLGLRAEDMPHGGLAFSGTDAMEQFASHLRTLVKGASWRDVFPDLPAHWDLENPESWTYPKNERALGTFDYPDAPRGSAVFASLDGAQDVTAGTAALAKIATIGIPIFGAGMVLDRGAPHMYVVLPLGAPNEHVVALSDFLREQPGMGNAFPERYEFDPPEGV